MFSSGIFWITIVLCIVIGQVVLSNRRKHHRRHHRPIVCVCDLNGRTGVLLRRDYDEASQKHWRPYYDGKTHYDSGHIMAPLGVRLKASPVFVFRSGSPEFYTLMYGCYVESAIFEIPDVEELNPLDEAYQHFHGEPRKDNWLIEW